MNHTIEVFTAGCSICKGTIELMKKLASAEHEVQVHDMQEREVSTRAAQYGIRSIPAVVIDGKLASCCAERGPDENTLRAVLR